MKRKLIAYLAAFGVAVSLCLPLQAAGQPVHDADWFDGRYMESDMDYGSYRRAHGAAGAAVGAPTEICAEQLIPVGGAEAVQAGGEAGVRLSAVNQAVQAAFSVETEGYYTVELRYYTDDRESRNVEAALELDGDVPFRNAARLTLSRLWQDEGPIRTNEQTGNQAAPRQQMVPGWQTVTLQSREGEYRKAYALYLTAGEHRLGLTLLESAMTVGGFTLRPEASLPDYEAYAAGQAGEDRVPSDYRETWQAEAASLKSSGTFSPSADRTSPHNEPYHVSQIRINVIGSNWSSCGDWIEWRIRVPEDGWYQLHFRYRQDANKGLPSHRSLSVDGAVPFAEAAQLAFAYTESFASYSLSDTSGRPLPLYLTAGEHTLRLTVTAGELSEAVYALTDTLNELNTVYREILMITGVNPDQYTDYDLDTAVPQLRERLAAASAALKQAYAAVQTLSGGRGNQAELLNRFAAQLDSFGEKIATLSLRLTEFRDNISALSAWLMDIRQQPLMLDSFTLTARGAVSPYRRDGFFDKLWLELRMFFASFFSDYEYFTAREQPERITLWLSAGRDQGQVLQTMIEDMFTPDTGIGVEIRLVSAGLTQAYLSGDCPDVSVMQGRGQPVNLGARGALLALEEMPGFDEVAGHFQPTALVPYTLDGHCYGLPDSQSFFMMFYRKDIFRELSLSVPETWEELLFLSNVLQRSNMEIGLPYTSTDANASVDVGMASRNIFSALLLQNGGQFYADDLSRTALLSEEAQQAFCRWTDFYLLHDIPLTYNFYNRFRTGEMPIGIADYTLYNQLSSAALEIRGLWEMVPIPGIRQADGSVDRSQGSTGSACVILKDTEHAQAAWRFLCWWTGAEAQSRYMQDIESVLGVTARYPTATTEAFRNAGWNRREYASLTEQWRQVEDIPEVVGSYYVVRGLDNAFREAILEGRNPREALSVWNRSINAEIERKRKEFHLEADR